ncbi:MAG: aldehyde dehydrogenase family protein [Flammeovirgaceae bacterium]|nr:aldehyde dehydrogenase family protein [Flammeovirgaceae bacterium]
MNDCDRFYLDGVWVRPQSSSTVPIINPATEEKIGSVVIGNADDINLAVSAARTAFDRFGKSTVQERLTILQRLAKEYANRYEAIVESITKEMGVPIALSRGVQAATGTIHIETAISILKNYTFETIQSATCIVKEPIGVCGLITPWNWPINQIACKVFPAIAAGCTVVWKPSELSPISASILAEVFDAAEVPAGVFNLVHGDGQLTGAALSCHPDVDMISFTGSTRAGAEISRRAASTVKRVTTELGGKSANILLDDPKFGEGVELCTTLLMVNSGQSCAAPTRLLVPQSRMEEAEKIAASVAGSAVIGHPNEENVTLGPLANKNQFNKVQKMIQTGISEGAVLICGGIDRPKDLAKGYFVKPTIFSDVKNSMEIARQEIFGPVLCIIPYNDEEDAIRIANDSDYGLSGYVYANDHSQAISIARRLRTGSVFINGADIDPMAPLGGFKHSGNGREWGVAGLEEYLETKSLIGFKQSSDSDGISLT